MSHSVTGHEPENTDVFLCFHLMKLVFRLCDSAFNSPGGDRGDLRERLYGALHSVRVTMCWGSFPTPKQLDTHTR